MKALEVLKKVQSSEVIISDETQRFPDAATDGDGFRQGDVYIWKRDKLPMNVTKTKCVLQLAPGTTKGSRHCLDSSDGATMFVVDDADALQGPWLKLDCERTVTHPEHGDVVLPAGCYEITYQRAYADELRRVQD